MYSAALVSDEAFRDKDSPPGNILNILFLPQQHPGGHDVLLEHAGRDATIAFIGTGHSKAAFASLKMYEIGELPLRERMYRCQGMLSKTVLPD